MGLLDMFRRPKHITDFRGRGALVFSSDQAFVDYYRRIFVSLGLVPATRATSEKLLAALQMMNFALIVMDHNEGDSECRKLLEHIRRVQKHAVVLVISQRGDILAWRRAMALEATDCFNHPALRDDIARTMLSGHQRGHQSLQQSA